MELVLMLLAGIALGAVGVYFAYRSVLQGYAQSQEADRQELAEKNEQLVALNRQVAERDAQHVVLEEKFRTQKADMEALQERQKLEFKNLANEILEQKSRQFKESNKESLETLLRPFRSDIESFRKKVEEVYVDESKQRFSLKEEIRSLNEMNQKMSQEATNLTKALKGNSKVQGDWGEMILETILDSSNLTKGIHYLTQENLKDETGANLRPDVILNLPEGKQIIIDSKVSLTAYVAYTETEDPEIQSRLLKDHLRSVRTHIDSLGSKSYQKMLNLSTDFVIMFVPSEPAFLLALQNDTSLWSDAYNKKVVVSSPTNLFALLKIVDDLWKRDNQSKNALDIAKQGADLYDKFVGFSETLLDLGKSISAAGDKYEKAMNQLKTGNGNLIRRTERLKELGIKVTKKLPQPLENYDDEE